MKTMEERVEGCSLICSIGGGEDGRARSLGWGLEQMTNGSTIHTNLHKLNNKLVSA
jgi:hypothetical protein